MFIVTVGSHFMLELCVVSTSAQTACQKIYIYVIWQLLHMQAEHILHFK